MRSSVPCRSWYKTRSSPSKRTGLTACCSNSLTAPIGIQYRRRSSPIGVPGPTRVSLSLSFFESITSLTAEFPVELIDESFGGRRGLLDFRIVIGRRFGRDNLRSGLALLDHL